MHHLKTYKAYALICLQKCDIWWRISSERSEDFICATPHSPVLFPNKRIFCQKNETKTSFPIDKPFLEVYTVNRLFPKYFRKGTNS